MNDHVSSGKASPASERAGVFARLARPLGHCILLLALIGAPLSMSSCTTDAYGNTAVTPGGAAAIGIGAAAVGAITAGAISNNRHHNRHHGHHYRGHHRPYHGHGHHGHHGHYRRH